MDLIHSKSLDPWSNFFFHPRFLARIMTSKFAPENIYRAPKRRGESLPTSHHFSGANSLLNFGAGYYWDYWVVKQKLLVLLHSMLGAKPKFFFVRMKMVPSRWSQTSPETGIWKTPPNRILMISIVFRISSWNLFEYLCQSTQRRLSGATLLFCDSHTFAAPFGA